MWHDALMDDGEVNIGAARLQQQSAGGWQAHLQLQFARRGERTLLARRQHEGPLVIQKTLHPEGEAVCHGIIVHPPGGVAGGDALRLDATLAAQTQVLLTTPGAGKWYKANGRQASQQLDFKLGQGACLEWLPQENILFDGSQLAFAADITLAPDACYAGWDILCFGRQASQEQWRQGELQQRLEIRRDDRLIWSERLYLQAGQALFDSLVGLRGQAVSGSFVVAAGAVPRELLEQCRQVAAQQPEGRAAVTALPELLSARYIGASSQQARRYFEALWQILRPWYAARPMARPRIWST